MTQDFSQIILGPTVFGTQTSKHMYFFCTIFGDKNCETSCFTFFLVFAITFYSDSPKKTYSTSFERFLHNKQVCFDKECQ